MKISTVLVSLSFLIIVKILSGCATQGIPVNVKRPAEVDLGKVQRIAVGRFTGRGGEDIGEDLTQELTNSNQFKVIDRNKVERLIKESRLAANGLVDQETAVELGKLIGVAAFVDGRVSTYDHQEKTDSYTWKDKKNKSYRSYTREGTVTVEVAFNVVDLETGQVLLSKKISKRNTDRTSNINGNAPRIDYVPLYLATRRAVVNEFMKSIAPYEETVNVQILTEEGIPELERGLAFVKINEWHKAINIFKQAAFKHPDNAKVLYNLGVAYKYTYQFDSAEKYLEAAYIIDQNNIYEKELNHLRIMRKDEGRNNDIYPAPMPGSYTSDEPKYVNVQPNTENPLNLAWVQKRLDDLGYDCGETDGIMGSKTSACIRAFQLARGLNVTGSLDNSTIAALLESK